MIFPDFAQRIGGVIRGESSTSAFTRTLFESIIPVERVDALDEYSDSSFKAYYNGQSKITRIARKINPYTEPALFETFIYDQGDAVAQKLCGAFVDVFPDIGLHNVGELLSTLFDDILNEASGTTKKSTPKDADERTEIDFSKPFAVITPEEDTAPDLIDYKDGTLYYGHIPGWEEPKGVFDTYLEKAVEFHSAKKTLLYAERPRPFYEMYVCNDIRYHRSRISGGRDNKPEITISDATVQRLESESRYIIIEGTGGIGKTMFLTHLFLSAADEFENTGELPIFVPLKDYRESTAGLVEFIWRAVKNYDANITQGQIIEMLEEKRILLLFDGLDEIQSALRDNFDADLEAFIKSYPGNTVIISSRPVYAFVSYTRFSLFDIEPLTKAQAIALVTKLDFWDVEAKQNFLEALDRHLYFTHIQFASNPLLLTIMLMTYSAFGEVPAKMHVLYSKAYETMARLHDATKGSFKRPLHTGMTPERFSKLFAEFCARTYTEETLEFTDLTFASYMDKVLKGTAEKERGVTPRDFLLDLTDNLCIMYKEGQKYYFIHRSFQEYFAALHFATDFEDKLYKVGNFFERMQNRSYTDRTFDMLYDMIPEKVERYIFLPFLDKLAAECTVPGEDAYWKFLEHQYPAIYHDEGNTDNGYINEAQSFLYKAIVREKKLGPTIDIDDITWPVEVHELPTKKWVRVYRYFMDSDAYAKYPDPEKIDPADLEETALVPLDELHYKYEDYFGEPDVEGSTIEIEIYELQKTPKRYDVLRRFMETPGFPLLEEYGNVKQYHAALKSRTEKEQGSEDLFDD